MPAAFGAWYPLGGHVNPFHFKSSIDSYEQVQKYARKHKHGKPVGQNELIEKFKALEIVNFDRYVSGLSKCGNCLWMAKWWKKIVEDDDPSCGHTGWDESFEQCMCMEKAEGDNADHDWHMFKMESCKLPCMRGFYYNWYRGQNTRGVYALNREAFAIHDAHRRKDRSSASPSKRHPSSGQKRAAAKRDARDELRDFEYGE